MKTLDEIKKEHGKIEQYMKEIEVIMSAEPINYPNLIHTFNELTEFWDKHEEKEEKLFELLNEEGFNIPIEKIKFEHGELRKHQNAIKDGMSSGSEFKLKESLENNGKEMIKKIRTHINFEDEFIYTIPISQFKESTITKLETLKLQRQLIF